ncbi:hypothetical protein B0A52_09985 [Exophiala mesophila]|uniref:Uncharacterized protein n=1 Tax=Exophiala mesophila TaxID=212818 RepID=A0A438MS34_EXOME|nr:hypothetical protein B0A52_09985 [Exophiala mesophila]
MAGLLILAEAAVESFEQRPCVGDGVPGDVGQYLSVMLHMCLQFTKKWAIVVKEAAVCALARKGIDLSASLHHALAMGFGLLAVGKPVYTRTGIDVYEAIISRAMQDEGSTYLARELATTRLSADLCQTLQRFCLEGGDRLSDSLLDADVYKKVKTCNLFQQSVSERFDVPTGSMTTDIFTVTPNDVPLVDNIRYPADTKLNESRALFPGHPPDSTSV